MSKETQDNGRARNIVQGMGSLAAQNIGTSVLGFVFQIALIRLIPLAQYGVYSAVGVAIGIAGTCATFGLNQSVARYVALLQQQDEQKSWVAVRKILYLVLGLTVVITAVYLVIAPYLSLYFTKGTTWTGVFLLSGIWLFLTPLSSICLGIIQGLRRYTLLAKISFIPKLVMVLFAVGSLVFYRNIEVAILAWVVYTGIIVAWTIAITGRNMTHAKGEFEYSAILKYTTPLGIAGIITVIASSADLVVVGGYLNSASLGIYNAAVIISSILALFVSPLTIVLLPEMSSSNSDADLSNGLRLALRYAVLLILPASLLLAALSNQLIELFSGGGAYLAGSPSLELIALFYLFVAVQTMLVVLFQAIGKTVYAMIVGFATVATDIGLSLLLVPSLGLLGAASAKVSVGVVGAIAGYYFAKKYLQKLDKRTFYFKGLIAALVPFVVTLGLSDYVSIRLISLVPYAIVYFLIFLACVKFLKLLNAEDREFISHILPKFMQRLTNRL